MNPAPVAKSLEACSTPEPQKAAVFNVAEYKRQMALKQSPPSAKKDVSSKATTPPSAAVKPVASSPAKTKPVSSEESNAAVVDLANPGTPIMKVEVSEEKRRLLRHFVSFFLWEFFVSITTDRHVTILLEMPPSKKCPLRKEITLQCKEKDGCKK
jgi:hypothetical protein